MEAKEAKEKEEESMEMFKRLSVAAALVRRTHDWSAIDYFLQLNNNERDVSLSLDRIGLYYFTNITIFLLMRKNIGSHWNQLNTNETSHFIGFNLNSWITKRDVSGNNNASIFDRKNFRVIVIG